MRTKPIRLIGAVLLAVTITGIGSAHPTYAATTNIGCPDFTQLQTAISNATSGDILQLVCPDPATITFPSTITIGKSVTLDGSRSERGVTLDGSNSAQLFWVQSGVSFGLIGLTLAHGHASTSDTYNSSYGGVMKNFGTVLIADSTLAHDSATSGAGAVYNGGTLTIRNSTLTDNSAGQNGGAIFNAGTATISNSTLDHNTAVQSGGAIYDASSSPVVVAGSIVTNNSASSCNIALTDGGYNLTNGFGSVVSTCGLTGTGDRFLTDPRLKALANNGGPTETLALEGTSPAVDAIPDTSALCLAVDQRGVHRLDDGESSCDIGAYEHIEHLRVAVSVASGKYSVHIDGTTMEIGSTIDWRAVTPAGDHTGSHTVTSSILHLHAFTSACPSGHITVNASGREVTPDGVKDVTASYDGDPC